MERQDRTSPWHSSLKQPSLFKLTTSSALPQTKKKPYKILPEPTLNFALLTPHLPPGTPTSILAGFSRRSSRRT